jgi:CubicO group peptidase (beta-lactamase class C family)
MKDTASYVPEEKLARFSKTYSMTEENGLQLFDTLYVNEWYNKNWGFLSGGHGLTSTIKDYFNFALMFLHKGKFKGKLLLKPETIELIAENHLKDSKTIHDLALDRFVVDALKVKGYGMGLGIRVRIKESVMPTPIGEHGWLGIAHTYYWVDPLNEVIGLFMTQVFSPESFFMGTVDFKRVVQLAYAGLSLE